jgi:DNA-binding winged helix-turn-helix (wHTH) protein
MLPFARGGPAVLLAVSDDRHPEDVARAMASVGLVPALAFDADELRAFVHCAKFAAIVIDEAVDATCAAVVALGGRRDVVLVYLARDVHVPAPAHVHAVLPCKIAALELASRVSSLLELRAAEEEENAISWGNLTLDLRRRRARFEGADVPLTPIQFRILAALVRARGGVLTKEELQAQAWPLAVPDAGERLVAHIRRIRAKLEPDPAAPRVLLTARGEGFRLADCGDAWDGRERRVGERRRRLVQSTSA